MEIAEDEEEDLRAKRQSTVPEERPSTAKTISASDPPPTIDLPDLPPELTRSKTNLSSTDDDSMPPPREPRSPTRSIGEGRTSFQSARPEMYNSSYGSSGRPKVKLGPRPSLDVGGRPHTSGASSYYRPVSTLPAGMKLFGRGGSKKEKERPQSLYPVEAPGMTLSPPAMPESTLQPSQDALVRPHTSGGRPVSSHSIKPLISPSVPTFPKTPVITPEKARLLRAMELRKKQQKATIVPNSVSDLPIIDPVEEASSSDTREASQDAHEKPTILEDVAKVDDSGIAFDSGSIIKTDESDATRSDSCPVSPVGPSEQAESTKASSISDSTDETVQEPHITNKTQDTEALSEGNVAIPETSHEIGKTVEIPIPHGDERESLETLLPTTYDPFQVPVDKVEDFVQSSNVTAAKVEEPLQSSNFEENELSEPESLLSKDVINEVSSPTLFEGVKTDQDLNVTAKLNLEPHSVMITHEEEAPKSTLEHTPEEDLGTIPAEANMQSTLMVASAQTAEPSLIVVSTGEPSISSVPEFLVDETPAHIPLLTQKPEVSSDAQKSSSLPANVVEDSTASALEEQPQSPTRTWKVPRSKFSVQDLRAEMDPPEIPTEPLPQPYAAVIPSPEKSPIGSTFSTATRGSFTEDDHGIEDNLSKRNKRKGLVEPIRTDIDLPNKSGGNSEANFSSDDDLMEELQSAVFQDAKPISVSKSPISPVFPSLKNQTAEKSRFARATSGFLRKDSSDSQMLELPGVAKAHTGPMRSVSAGAAYLNRINQQAPKPIAKKVNLGSGISQRIKALEKLSSLTDNASPTEPTTPNPRASTAFFSVRKSSVRTTSNAPSVAERASSLTRHSPSPSSSPDAPKIRERSGSLRSRLDAFNSAPVSMAQPPRSRPESVSVTARIIRDPAQPYPAKFEVGKDPADYTPLDLKQSPLVIDHRKAIVEPQKETIQERRKSRERRLSNSSKTAMKDRRSSITVIKDLISDGRASFSDRRRSINLEPSLSTPSILSPSRPPSVHQSPARRPSSVSSSSRRNSRDLAAGFSPPPTAGSLSSTSDDRSEKKSTRASRMLRRMSSSLSAGRKTIAHVMSPTVREESEPVPGLDFLSPTSSQPSNAPITPTITGVGDVNVQFPDSLLWKRRSMLLDSAGYVILSPALTTGKQGSNVGATRRFHMSEFRTPAIPDVEMQELPNSVVLDFIEGGGLQVACEDRAGQGRLLKSMATK
jgi:hypothetical protein